MSRRSRIPQGGVLLVALSLANGSNYLFQVVMSRLLGPADYSLLGGVYSVVTVVAVSTQALQTASAKAVAAAATSAPPLTSDTLIRATVKWGALVTALTLAATPLFSRFLHSGSGPTIGLAFYTIPAALLAIGFGRLQGLEAFGKFALLSIALAGGRLILGPVAFLAGFGVTGVVLAGVVTTLAAGIWAVHQTRSAPATRVEALKSDIGRAGIALILFWVMASIDVPIARHALSSQLAGQYAAASVVGKAIIWLPGALSLIMFPRVTSLREQGLATHPPLVRAFIATFVLCACGVAALRVLGPTVIPIFFGDQYRQSVGLAWKVGLVCLPLALANLLVFYHLTRDTGRFVLGIVASLAVEVGMLSVYHGSPTAIVGGLGAGSVALLVLLFVPGLVRRVGFPPSGEAITTWFRISSQSK